MLLQKKIQLTKIEHDKTVVERLVHENIEGKLDAYLKKFKEGTQWTLDIHLEGNKKWWFNGVIHCELDGQSFRAEREDYKNLDDLINHLFDHIKEQMSKRFKGGIGRLRGIFGSLFQKQA